MAKMTKAQARRRLEEGRKKFLAVFMSSANTASSVLSVTDLKAIEKITYKAMNKLK